MLDNSLLLRAHVDSSAVTRFEVERVSSSAPSAAPLAFSPSDDDELEELEIGDVSIDEAELPQLDTDDPEALGQDAAFEDLIDHGWLERAAEEELDEEGGRLDDIGLTIDLDGPTAEEDGAQVVDLDVGSLLVPLPEAGEAELELEPVARERSETGSIGIGALRDLLLPESGEDDDSVDERPDDREVGDDDHFPVFDDARDIAPRPSEDDEDTNHGDELS
jgi:hypothetical protein